MNYIKQTILFTLIISGLNYNALCQNDDSHEEEFSKINNHSDGVSPDAFISKSFFITYKLAGGDTTKTRMRIWSAKEKGSSDYNQVYDIRWKFESHDEALDFYYKFMDINSENSTELRKPEIEIKDADEVKVFEDLNSEQMMKAFGFSSKNYCFLLVVNTYVIKIYISADDKIKVADAKIFAEEAAARTKKVSS